MTPSLWMVADAAPTTPGAAGYYHASDFGITGTWVTGPADMIGFHAIGAAHGNVFQQVYTGGAVGVKAEATGGARSGSGYWSPPKTGSSAPGLVP